MLSAGLLIAGKYRVVKKLGEGAMGSVWLAINEITEREFAIKVLLPAAASAPAALGRFFQEAKVCGSLRHPAILEIYDAGTAPELDGAPYLVMERLDGAALDVVLEQRGALPTTLALDVVAQIARGLDLAHKKGIIHRDLKPANIFLHRPGSGVLEPKVLDFGISKIIQQNTPSVKFTETSAVVGSPLYMSPEQLSGDKGLDARSDVHALGVVLWECLAGAAPFSTTSYNLLVVEILKGPRPRLRHDAPEVPGEVARIVERAIAIERDERYASAGELADALETELAKLGGGMLGTRGAAVDVLGTLTLLSKAPPPHVPSSALPQDAHLLDTAELGPLPSTMVSQPESSLAATETAPEASLPRPPPLAVAASAEVAVETVSTRAPRARIPYGLVASALAIVGVALFVARGRSAGSPPAEPGPASSASVAVVTAAPPPTASASPSPPSAPASTVVASASAVASSQPLPAIAQHPKIAQSGLPTPVPVTRRPKIDQAGLPAPSARPRIDQSGL